MMMRLLLLALMVFAMPAFAQDSGIEDSLIQTVHKSEEAKKQTITPSELKARIREAVKERQKTKEAPKKAAMTAKPKVAAAKKALSKPVVEAQALAPQGPGLPDMQVGKNVPYGDDAAQVMDIYAPYGSGSAPVLLFVEATTWLKDDKQDSVSKTKIQYWTRKGVIVAVLRTRMAPSADISLAAEDVARAVFYLKDNLKRWGGDPERIAGIGFAAGAHVLMLAASDAAINRGVTWNGNIVLDNPVYDATGIMRGRPSPMLKDVFGEDAPDNWARLSPYSRVSGPVGPSLLVCQSQIRDGCAQAEKYQAKSQRFGNTVTILPVAKDHSQINNDLGSDGPYTNQIDTFLKHIGVL